MRKIILFAITALLFTGFPVESKCAVNIQTIAHSKIRTGIINANGAAGSVSKEVDDLLTKAANNNDLKTIDSLLEAGLVVHLPKGTKVEILERKLFLTKIRTDKGQVLYIASEHVTIEDK